MATVKLDEHRRITLPEGSPGDEYEFQKLGEGRFLLIRVGKRDPSEPRSPEEMLKIIEQNPIPMVMTWEELRQMTREP